MLFFRIKVCIFHAFLENDKIDLRKNFFPGLEENISLLQPAYKSTAPAFKVKYMCKSAEETKQNSIYCSYFALFR